MCKNQLGRRNLSEEQRAYIIKEEHESLLKMHGVIDDFHGNQHVKVSTALGENGQGKKTKGGSFQARKVIAEERGITEGEVRYAVEFGRGLDAADAVAPGIKAAVLSGETKAPKSLIAKIRNTPEEKRPAAVEAIKSGNKKGRAPIQRPAHVVVIIFRQARDRRRGRRPLA
jgi:hypothetical protein